MSLRAVVIPIIQERIEAYSSGEIKFNLMAIVGNRTDKLQRALDAAVAAGATDAADDARAQLAEEAQRRCEWADDNARRRHDYVPFMLHFLTLLADVNALPTLLERAVKERAAAAATAQGAAK